MQCSTLVNFVTAVILTTMLSDAAKPRRPAKDRRNPAELSFDPCRSEVKTSKKRLMKLAITLGSSCGLNLISLTSEDWGNPAHFFKLTPVFRTFACKSIRVLYGFFSTGNGYLVDRIVKDPTDLYNVSTGLIVALLADQSVRKDWCVQDPGGRVCISKTKILQLAKLGQSCLLSILDGSTLRSADAAVYVLSAMLKVAESTPLLKHLAG